MTDLSEKGCDPVNNAIGSLKETNIKVEVKKKGGRAILETYGALTLDSYAEVDVGHVDYSRALLQLVEYLSKEVPTAILHSKRTVVEKVGRVIFEAS